jgi:hypothetical protein
MKENDKHTTVQDGYQRKLLHEGYVRKGGQNPAHSQVQKRPPAPVAWQRASSDTKKG